MMRIVTITYLIFIFFHSPISRLGHVYAIVADSQTPGFIPAFIVCISDATHQDIYMNMFYQQDII